MGRSYDAHDLTHLSDITGLSRVGYEDLNESHPFLNISPKPMQQRYYGETSCESGCGVRSSSQARAYSDDVPNSCSTCPSSCFFLVFLQWIEDEEHESYLLGV